MIKLFQIADQIQIQIWGPDGNTLYLHFLTPLLLISRGVGCMRHGVNVHCMPYIIDLVHNAFGNVYDFGLWHWHVFWHLDDLGVVFHTATLEGFFNLESGLRDWALLNHWVVVGVLGGHLRSLRYLKSSLSYMYKTNWSVVTFNSPEARLSKVDTRSWGTPASSSSFTQMCVLSSLIQDLRQDCYNSVMILII